MTDLSSKPKKQKNEMHGTVRDMQEDEFWQCEFAGVSGDGEFADELEESAEASSWGSRSLNEVGAKGFSTCATRAAESEMVSFKASCEAWALREELEGRQPKRDTRKRAPEKKKEKASQKLQVCFTEKSVTQLDCF